MDIIDNLIKEFILDIIDIKEKETIDQVSIEVQCSKLALPNPDTFNSILKNIDDRDRILINIYSDGYEIATYSSVEDDNVFFRSIEESINNQEDENYEFNIRIIKTKDDSNNISVYKLNSFIKCLVEFSFDGILFEFEKILNESNIIFRIQDNEDEFYTKSIYFLRKDSKIEIDEFNAGERIKKLDKRNQICNFLNASQYNFIPDDFKLAKMSKYQNFNNMMFKLTTIFSLIFIANISSILDSNKIKIIINGYKSVDNILDYSKDYNVVLEKYYKIQEWIYNNGNLNDKVGIVRNVITLDIQDNSLLCIRKGVYDSILSAHEIYLKENIKEYLEVKNKVTEFLFSMSQKTSDLPNNFAKSFINNLKVIVTFFATIIVMNAFSDKRLQNIFTKDIVIISIGLLVLSIVFLVVSIKDTNEEKDRYRVQYYRLKSSYDEVLNVDDINNIFKNDSYYNEDLIYIDEKVRKYTITWIVVILVIFIVVITLGSGPLKNEIAYLNRIIANNISYVKNIIYKQ